MKIGLDANILSTLLNSIENDELSGKIKQFLKSRATGNLEIVISSIVLAEIFSYAETAEVQVIIDTLQKIGNVSIIQFDKKSSIENGVLVKSLGLKNNEKTRQETKTDYLIASNYKAYNSNIFLTGDKAMIHLLHSNISLEFIDVGTLPSPYKDLFGNTTAH